MKFFSRGLFVDMQLESDRLKKTTYTVTHLRRTLIDILEHGQGVCIRFRVIGEMWQSNFVRIVSVTEQRVLVNDEVMSKLLSIEISKIIQFEIDHRFKGLEPYNHYDITWDNKDHP